MTRYGMVINLDRCVGCEACVVGCTMHHGLPEGDRWSSVHEKTTGAYPDLSTLYLPRLCMHCENPVCVEVCPQDATYKREDGIVLVEQGTCIGCGTCVQACPYGARNVVDKVASNHGEGGPTVYEEHAFAAHQDMKAEKCIFCADRVEAGGQPVCVQTCVSNARIFGDLDDPESDVAKAAAKGEVLGASFGTNPSVFYISSSKIAIDDMLEVEA